MKSAATIKPMMGEKMSGSTTLLNKPDQTTLPVPSAAIPAPTMPPISAWLEEEGIPKYHVMRFQVIAPIRAAITRTCAWENDNALMALLSIRPLVIVFATAWPVSAPTKLSTAAIMMAAPGLSTRVATTVATALAVSWKPLMKSNATASTITRARSVQASSPNSGMFDHQPAQYVGNVLGFVSGLLHLVVDI